MCSCRRSSATPRDGPSLWYWPPTQLLDAAEDPWGVADWWLGANAWLGAVPAQLLGRVADDVLLDAARAVLVEG